jgi:hypothetical protein
VPLLQMVEKVGRASTFGRNCFITSPTDDLQLLLIFFFKTNPFLYYGAVVPPFETMSSPASVLFFILSGSSMLVLL